MKNRVRIGKVGDQDRWRREDLLAMSPDERVGLLLDMQHHYFGDQINVLVRVARIRTFGAKPA